MMLSPYVIGSIWVLRSGLRNELVELMAILISVASGKGGVGKSVVSTNVALALAKSGRQVILADLDVGGADAHILFGQLNPCVTLTDFLNKKVRQLEDAAIPVTLHPNLRLIAGTGETLATANMVYARKKRLMKQFQEIKADVVVIDIGAGTTFHALDFFLMADIHVAVAMPEPTSVLDLYRFIKLAAIRRVLSCFLARSPLSEVLSNRDFTSVEEVMEVAGATDVEGRDVAAAAVRSFRPGLIINRVTGRSQVNVLYLRKILQDYVGGDLQLLGEIPDDPAVSQAVRNFLPVIEAAPDAPAARGLLAVAISVGQLVKACASERAEQKKGRGEVAPAPSMATTESTVHLFVSPTAPRPELPTTTTEQNVASCAETVRLPDQLAGEAAVKSIPPLS